MGLNGRLEEDKLSIEVAPTLWYFSLSRNGLGFRTGFRAWHELLM